MSITKMKSLARAIQARNPSMKYTAALRMARQLPDLDQPLRNNLLIAGSAGSGCSVAMRAFAARAVDDGMRIVLISGKDSWGPWLTSAAETAVSSFYSYDLERTYAEKLLQVEAGSPKRPLFVGLDNLEYLLSSEYKTESLSKIEELAGSLYTYVTIRLQRPDAQHFPLSLNAQFKNRLLMGRNPLITNLMMFEDAAHLDDNWRSIPRGQGYLKAGPSMCPKRVKIPFDSAVQKLNSDVI